MVSIGEMRFEDRFYQMLSILGDRTNEGDGTNEHGVLHGLYSARRMPPVRKGENGARQMPPVRKGKNGDCISFDLWPKHKGPQVKTSPRRELSRVEEEWANSLRNLVVPLVFLRKTCDQADATTPAHRC